MLPEFAKCVPKSVSQRVRCRGQIFVTKKLNFSLILGVFWFRKSIFARILPRRKVGSSPEALKRAKKEGDQSRDTPSRDWADPPETPVRS